MARIGSNDWLDVGTWADEEDPGAGAQDFVNGHTGTGLNGNWVKIWKAITSFFNGYGIVKDGVIDKNHLKTTVADGSTIERHATAGLRVMAAGIGTNQIANAAVTQQKIANSAVGANQIADDAITAGKIAAGAVDDTALQAGSVTNTKIAAGAVTTDKLEYKEYVALVSQLGTDPPIVTVVRNTLGDMPVWSRTSPGFYDFALDGAFPVQKTVWQATNGSAFAVIALTHYAGVQAPNGIQMRVYNSGGTLSDNILLNATIIIRVYP